MYRLLAVSYGNAEANRCLRLVGWCNVETPGASSCLCTRQAFLSAWRDGRKGETYLFIKAIKLLSVAGSKPSADGRPAETFDISSSSNLQSALGYAGSEGNFEIRLDAM